MSFLPGNFAICPALLREYHILPNAASSGTWNSRDANYISRRSLGKAVHVQLYHRN
jgi:hypothetical protein